MTNLKLFAALAAILVAGCVADVESPPEQATITAPATEAVAAPKTFRAVTAVGPSAANAPQLMNDGTILVQDADESSWWKLTPDANGDYAKGTWTQLADMPAGYGPLYFASATLPDGRLLVEGGEYNLSNTATRTTIGAIYDPTTDQWTNVNPPSSWGNIGDASGMLLPNGTFLLSNCCTNQLATFDADTLTWHNLPDPGHESSSNNEESWALLWDNTILTVDSGNTGKPTESERLDLTTMTWSSAGSTIVPIADNQNAGSSSLEEGPILMRPNGVAVAIGTTAHTAMFDTATMTWTAGPDMPKVGSTQLGSKDGPGAVLPDGDVFIGISPAPLGDETFPQGLHFYEFDGTTFTEATGPAGSSSSASFVANFLVLPTGEIMVTTQSSDVEIYTPSPGVAANAVPTISSAPHLVTTADADPIVPLSAQVDIDPETGVRRALLPLATIHPGRTYKVAGNQLNGLSQGAYYGDDEQAASNHPIVRITSMASGHVKYLNTHHSSSYAITPNLKTTAFFDVPADAEQGIATMVAVANGVASPPVVVNIK